MMNYQGMPFLSGSGTNARRWLSRSATWSTRSANQLLIPLVMFVIAGCSQSGNVKTYPVKGLVTFEGKPMVGGGAISLIPTTSQPGKTAAGIIKPDGTYVLGTYTEAD